MRCIREYQVRSVAREMYTGILSQKYSTHMYMGQYQLGNVAREIHKKI